MHLPFFLDPAHFPEHAAPPSARPTDVLVYGSTWSHRYPLRHRVLRALTTRPHNLSFAVLPHPGYAHADAPRECASGCVAGDLKFWDARAPGASLRTVDVQNSTMTAFDAHGNAPLLASGSHNQFIKFMARDGDQLNIVRYHDGFLGQRIGPVSSLAFHPTKVLCAAGSTDAVVGIYAAQ